jgi:hypothetical protein
MKRVILLLAGLMVMSPVIHASELYRWIDKAGKVNYGDLPPPGATGVERLRFSGNPAQDQDLPFETRRAMENFPVTLYVADGCGDSCDQAHALLGNRGIPYSEKLLRSKQDIDAFKQLSGIYNVVPVLGVGKEFLKGYSEILWNSELDIAGYPKTANIRQRTAPPKPEPFTPAATPAEGQSPEGQPPVEPAQ